MEEAHQKVRAVINCSRDVFFAARGAPPLDQRSAEFAALRQSVLDTERQLLYTLEFDVGVALPYTLISTQLTAWKEAGAFEPQWPRTAKNSAATPEVVQGNTLARNIAYAMCGGGEG